MSYEPLVKRLTELRAGGGTWRVEEGYPGSISDAAGLHIASFYDERDAALVAPAHEYVACVEALVELADAADAHCALQDMATDKRVGLTQPITVAEGEALNEARSAALGTLDALAKALLP